MSAPKGFPIRRLKFAASLNDDSLGETTEPNYELQYIDIGNVDSGGRIHEIATYLFAKAPSRARRKALNGDVIISTVRTYLQAIAAISHPPENLVVSTGFAVARSKPDFLDPGFFKYALRESRFLHEVEARSIGVSYPAINSSELADIPIHLPPLAEQRRIAAYLDAETARIDALVTEKEQLLALLEEKRAAQISRAVTRGLDSQVSLKPSGLPWLGDIPVNWETIRIKYFCAVGNGSTPNVENADFWTTAQFGFPWLNSSVVNDEIIIGASRFVSETALSKCHLPQIEPPALLVGITGQGKTRGMCSVLTFAATINQHLAYLKPKLARADCEFLRLLLDTAYVFLRSESDGAGGTKGAITCEQLGEFALPLPPLAEQHAIVAYLAAEKQRTAELEASLLSSLALLHERRRALITAAVTGQLPALAA